MATVDLDALEAEMSASIGKDKTFDAMQIIRRAVSPPAPEGLRDRLARTMWDAYWSSSPKTIGFPWEQSEEQHVWVAMADAVLAVLPPAPRVDEITNQRALEALQRDRSIHEDNYNRAKKVEDHAWMKRYKFELDRTDSAIAVIRAMLEGTA